MGSQPDAAQAVTAQALKKVPSAASTAAATATTVAAPSLNSLQYAAEGGHPVAQWKLGRMYADGDGVIQDDLRAFEYFSRIANAHAEDSPSAPQATIVANAFVALGRYYLNGIPNSKIKPDSDRARRCSPMLRPISAMPTRYDLARLYLKTPDASRDEFRYGARWLRWLPEGPASGAGDARPDAVRRRPAAAAGCRGLMWLTLARDNAAADESWIRESYNRAFTKASDDDRAMAFQMLEHWVQGKKD